MFRTGDQVIMKPSITTRPSYFNPDGLMDKYLGGKLMMRVDGFGSVRLNGVEWPCIKISDHANGTTWLIKEAHVQPKDLDNRRILHV
jgi:hypothetical protein